VRVGTLKYIFLEQLNQWGLRGYVHQLAEIRVVDDMRVVSDGSGVLNKKFKGERWMQKRCSLQADRAYSRINKISDIGVN
jgi:hypothetical protein